MARTRSIIEMVSMRMSRRSAMLATTPARIDATTAIAAKQSTGCGRMRSVWQHRRCRCQDHTS
eukprot:2648823-Rhodomonas_salina.4